MLVCGGEGERGDGDGGGGGEEEGVSVVDTYTYASVHLSTTISYLCQTAPNTSRRRSRCRSGYSGYE